MVDKNWNAGTVGAKFQRRKPDSKVHTPPRCNVNRQNDKISVSGYLVEGEFKKILAAIHKATADLGYNDIELDFTECRSASPGCLLPICATAISLRANHHGIKLLLPSERKLARLFINTNWAHLLDPRAHDPATRIISGQVPARVFSNTTEQQAAVNDFILALLGNTPGLSRREFSAIEWTLNEVTDNVMNHAQSRTGGLVQLSVLERESKFVELVVADPGIGIPASLRTSRPNINDIESLDLAIREGVTRDKSIGQGNGLFGTFQICEKSNGRLRIDSGHGTLLYDRNGVRIRNESVPFDGTTIDARMALGGRNILDLALVFSGKEHVPVDFIELKYEADSLQHLNFVMKEEATSFGSRLAAKPVRVKLENLLEMCPGQKIRIDFAGIPIISSSFADEVFGRLFVALGPLAFMSRFEFAGIDSTLRILIDRAISQRSVTDLGNRLNHTEDY